MKYKHNNFVIVCHDSVFGPPHELRDFLNARKAGSVLLIGHRNRYIKDNPVRTSYFELYKNGIPVRNGIAKAVNLPEMVGYVRDFIITLRWVSSYTSKPTFFIGLGNLNAFAGLALKIAGMTKNVIYYVIDYMPVRFDNKLLNFLYHALDKVCAEKSLQTWNYAQSMIDSRNTHWKKIFPRQRVVPNGIHIRRQFIKPFHKIHAYELIYVGSLYEQQGIQLVIESLPKLRQQFPEISLTVIGHGPFRDSLESLCEKLKVRKHVSFLGFVSDPVEMESRLSYGALGIGTYKPNEGFVSYTEPGKIKRYLAVGVPVVMTAVSAVADDITAAKCGIVCPYSIDGFSESVSEFLSSKNKQYRFRMNAIKYVKDYEWDSIFSNAFHSIDKEV